MENREEILNAVSKRYKQEDYAYALKNCLHIFLVVIAKESMQQYSDKTNKKLIEDIDNLKDLYNASIEMLAERDKEIERLREVLTKTINEKHEIDSKYISKIGDCAQALGNSNHLLSEYSKLKDEIEMLKFQLKAADSINEWISVEDRLPTERVEFVLLFNADAPKYNQCVYQGVWFLQEKKFKSDAVHNLLGTVTHWMPLPNQPK